MVPEAITVDRSDAENQELASSLNHISEVCLLQLEKNQITREMTQPLHQITTFNGIKDPVNILSEKFEGDEWCKEKEKRVPQERAHDAKQDLAWPFKQQLEAGHAFLTMGSEEGTGAQQRHHANPVLATQVTPHNATQPD